MNNDIVSSHTLKNIERVEIDRDFVYKIVDSFARKNSLELNPHRPTLMREIEGLLINYEKYGYPYCPCRLSDISGDLYKDKMISCPCVYHRKEIKDNGFCKCELFISPLEDKPRLISTTIHRMEISQSFNNNILEINFQHEGNNSGEVKIFIPENFKLGDVDIVTDGFYEIKDKDFHDEILFFNFVFSDSASIFVEFV